MVGGFPAWCVASTRDSLDYFSAPLGSLETIGLAVGELGPMDNNEESGRGVPPPAYNIPRPVCGVWAERGFPAGFQRGRRIRQNALGITQTLCRIVPTWLAAYPAPPWCRYG